MRIRHPASFFVLIAAIVLTSVIAVTWNFVHVVIWLVDIGAMTGLRALAIREGRKTF